MVEAAGFEIVSAEFRGGLYGAYTCVPASSRRNPRPSGVSGRFRIRSLEGGVVVGNGPGATASIVVARGLAGGTYVAGLESDPVTDVISSWWHLALAVMPYRPGD